MPATSTTATAIATQMHADPEAVGVPEIINVKAAAHSPAGVGRRASLLRLRLTISLPGKGKSMLAGVDIE